MQKKSLMDKISECFIGFTVCLGFQYGLACHWSQLLQLKENNIVPSLVPVLFLLSFLQVKSISLKLNLFWNSNIWKFNFVTSSFLIQSKLDNYL